MVVDAVATVEPVAVDAEVGIEERL